MRCCGAGGWDAKGELMKGRAEGWALRVAAGCRHVERDGIAQWRVPLQEGWWSSGVGEGDGEYVGDCISTRRQRSQGCGDVGAGIGRGGERLWYGRERGRFCLEGLRNVRAKAAEWNKG